jgi:hypothetical protein
MPQTPFFTGSNGKPFTALAIMQLESILKFKDLSEYVVANRRF